MKEHTIPEKRPVPELLNRLKFEVANIKGVFPRIIFFCLVTWLPLLILSLIQGKAYNSDLKISFLNDYETYARFLIEIPALFIADKFIKFQTSNSLVQFMESGIISENNAVYYENLIERYNNLLKSKLSEIIIVVLAIISILIVKKVVNTFGEVSSWKSQSDNFFTLAGYWYAFISIPVLQILLYRVLWKFIIWSWFLFKVSKMNLNLVASDPDQAGGLSFLGTVQNSFGLLGFAQAVSLSAEIANKIIYAGATFDEFLVTIITTIILAGLIYLIPLLFFCRKLTKLKLTGLFQFSILTHKYSTGFEDKWIKTKTQDQSEPLLGTGDIQSLADIGSSFERIEDMRMIPLSLRNALFMFIMIALPFTPLLLLKFSFAELLNIIKEFLL